MDAREVRNRVRQITRASIAAPDSVRALEDELFFDVLNAIAQGGDAVDMREMARAAIEARRIVVRRPS